MRAEKQVTLAPRSTTAIPDVEFWGAFFDTSYAYRFGPPSHDVTIATLRAPEGEPIAEAFHFPLGRAALPPPATIAASIERCPAGWRLRLKADFSPHLSASKIPPTGRTTIGSIWRPDARKSSG